MGGGLRSSNLRLLRAPVGEAMGLRFCGNSLPFFLWAVVCDNY